MLYVTIKIREPNDNCMLRLNWFLFITNGIVFHVVCLLWDVLKCIEPFSMKFVFNSAPLVNGLISIANGDSCTYMYSLKIFAFRGLISIYKKKKKKKRRIIDPPFLTNIDVFVDQRPCDGYTRHNRNAPSIYNNNNYNIPIDQSSNLPES